MTKVIIGVDPHKMSATIEVVDRHERLLGSGRFSTDQAGYAAMRTYAKNWPQRVWAIEGSNGAGRPLAQRLLEAGEYVVDVPAKLSARARLFDTGHNRKTDARDAHSVAIVAVRTATLRVLRRDGELEALRMLCDRREELTRLRVQTVNRLQRLLAELVPGQVKKDLTALQAKAILASVRPRDIAGKTRRRMAAEELADLVVVEAKMKKSTAELKVLVKARGSRLMDLHGVGPVVAARTLADVGDIARFADRNRFASWTGTAPLDASSGEQNRHRLSRAGNRRMNHMIHIAAISQIRLDTDGRAYYRRKRTAGKSKLEALRCLKRRISDALYRQLLADAERAQLAPAPEPISTGPGGHCGASQESRRSACPRTPTLRISHFPDPRNRRYNRPGPHGSPPAPRPHRAPLDNKGEPVRRTLRGIGSHQPSGSVRTALGSLQQYECPTSTGGSPDRADRKTVGRWPVMTEPDLSALPERADRGEEAAVDQLIELGAEQGNLEELGRVAEQGNSTAADQQLLSRPVLLPRVGVVLAAGRSERIRSITAGGSKALLRLGGLSLVERAVKTLLAAGVESVVVVVGHDAGPVAAVVDRLCPGRVRALYADRWEDGNGASLAAVEDTVAGEALFVLLTADHVFGDGAIDLLLATGAPAVLVDASPVRAAWDEGTRVRVVDGAVVGFGKHLDEPAIDCGVFLLPPDIFRCQAQAAAQGDHTLAGAVTGLAQERPLRAVALPNGCWWQDVDSPQDARAAAAALRASLGRPADGPVSRWLNRPLSTRLSMTLAPLRPDPDLVSLAAFVLGLGGAVLLAAGQGVAGALLVHASSVADGVDGEVARLQVRGRPQGALLDGVLDRVGDAAILAGLGLWALEGHDPRAVLALTVAATAGALLSMATKDRAAALGLPPAPERALGWLLGGRDGRLLLVAIGALLGAPIAALAAVTTTSAISLGLRVAFLRRTSGP